MSEAEPARRVAIATLLHLPTRAPAPQPPSPDLLQAERASGHAAALGELLPRIDQLEAALQEAEGRHATELQSTQQLASRLVSALETVMAAELADLAHAIAAAVLAAEPATSAQTLAALLADSVRALPMGTLHVPPELLESARALCPEGWALEAREGLAPGTVEAVAGPALQRQSLSGRLSALMEDRP